MLSISRPSFGSKQRHRGSISKRKDVWSCRTSTTTASSLNLKRQQQQRRLCESDLTTEERQPEEALLETPVSPKKHRVSSIFRLMTFSDSTDESESDYVPSDDEHDDEKTESEEEGSDIVTKLFEREGDEKQEEGEAVDCEEEELELEPDDDLRWWKSSKDKRRWEKRYHQADATFRKRYGCAIDTPSHPETTQRGKRRVKAWCRAYKLVLAGLVIMYLVQLLLVYSASSWAFSMVTWRPSTTGNSGGGSSGLPSSNNNRYSDESLRPPAQSSQKPVPEYVRTGLRLCSTLSRRVIKSEYDATATQHAVRACDITVKFAPENSREAIEAHVLRGDLLSMLSRFGDADEDYKAAMMLVLAVESSSADSQLAPGLAQVVDLKMLSNHWTQLYKTKKFKELRREARARAAQAEYESEEDGHASAANELAADWLSAFQQKKSVLEVLTLQRTWTLRRLIYEALDDGGVASSR